MNLIPIENLHGHNLNEKNISLLNERTIVVTKWDWEYASAHRFQRICLKLVQETPQLRILICTSHPDVLTNGRGLQKSRKEKLSLVDFNPELHTNLPFPLHQIERGGGLTFHHLGQFVFYPIVKLNPEALSLSRLMNQIFEFSSDILKEWGLEDLQFQNKLLGLWKNNNKIASMGIAIEKLTTFHGMALNLKWSDKVASALLGLNPCGLSSETYSSVDKYIDLPESPHEAFKEKFLRRIQNEW